MRAVVSIALAFTAAAVFCGGCDPEIPVTASAAANAVSVGSGATGAGATGGGGAGAAGGEGGAAGAGGLNDCAPDIAEDMRGMPGVTLAWANPHQRCVTVDVGTDVVWNGNFTAHPLEGGEAGTTDPASPISMASPTGMNTHVVFMAEGIYPYYCTNHVGTMKGVIYVEASGAGGAGGMGGGGNGGNGGS